MYYIYIYIYTHTDMTYSRKLVKFQLQTICFYLI